MQGGDLRTNHSAVVLRYMIRSGEVETAEESIGAWEELQFIPKEGVPSAPKLIKSSFSGLVHADFGNAYIPR